MALWSYEAHRPEVITIQSGPLVHTVKISIFISSRYRRYVVHISTLPALYVPPPVRRQCKYCTVNIYRRSRCTEHAHPVYRAFTSFNKNVERKCWSRMVRGAHELCCRAADTSITMITMWTLGWVLLGGIQKNLSETKTATLSPDSSGIYFWDRIWASWCPLEVLIDFSKVHFFVEKKIFFHFFFSGHATTGYGEVPDPAKKWLFWATTQPHLDRFSYNFYSQIAIAIISDGEGTFIGF